MKSEVDFKKILIHYVDHVGNYEGTTFINRHTIEGLTEPEMDALRAVDKLLFVKTLKEIHEEL